MAEVIVSMAILFVVAIAATSLVINLMRTARATQLRVTATNIATQDLQQMRALNALHVDQITSGSTTTTVSGLTYTISRTVTMVPATSPCTSGGYRIVQTTVTPRSSTRPVTLTTRIAC